MSLIRLTWGGLITSTDTGTTEVDEWSCSLSLICAPATNPAVLLPQITSPLASFHGATGTALGARALLLWVKVNEWDPAYPYHQITDPTVEYQYSPGYRGTVTSSTISPFLSMRVSLDDGTRNRRRKGGFYLPLYSGALSQNGRYSSTIQNNLLSSCTSFFGTLKGLSGVIDIGVWSRKDGAVWPVDRVRIGDVPDVIRSRKNALVESYVTATI